MTCDVVHARWKANRQSFCGVRNGFLWGTSIGQVTCDECRHIWTRGGIMDPGEVKAGTYRESEN